MKWFLPFGVCLSATQLPTRRLCARCRHIIVAATHDAAVLGQVDHIVYAHPEQVVTRAAESEGKHGR